MFTQHVYSRPPVITTYRRRTRIEHYIDSSEDDSDLDEHQQQPSLIPKKKQQQHASSLPIVQAPPPPILSSSPCRSETDQTGPLPVLSPYLSSDTTTITNARDQEHHQQQPDYADKPTTFGLLPLNDPLGVPTDNLLRSLQQPSNAVSEHVLLREQPIKPSPYDHSLYQSVPQRLYEFAEADTPTMSDDIRLLSFPSSSPSSQQQQQQQASYVDGFGLAAAAAAALSPSRQPSDAADFTHALLLSPQQQQKELECLELGEFACPGVKTRGSLPSAGETSADDAGASVAFQEELQQVTVAVEPSDIFAFPELPSAHPPRPTNQNSVTLHPPAEQQQKELLEFNHVRKQWTVPAEEPITNQPDVFDFPSSPPSRSHARKTQMKDVPAKTDIFDFPDEDPNDDEVIVASPVSLQQQHSRKKNKKMMIMKQKKRPLMMAVTAAAAAAAAGPSNVNRECRNKSQQQRKHVRFASEMQVSTFREQSFERDGTQTQPVQDKPVKRATNNNDENRRPPSSLLLLQQHHTLKRKRNLILGLKSASGVAATPGHLRRYDFDDVEQEEETPSVVAASQVQLREEDEQHGETTTTPSWLDLIGSDPDEQQSPESHRPQYQPQNPMNVRVTYGRHRTSQDPEMVELDNLLAQLRDCK